MKNRTGPKTKASRGEELHVRIAMTMPRELYNLIFHLWVASDKSRSQVISELVAIGYENKEQE